MSEKEEDNEEAVKTNEKDQDEEEEKGLEKISKELEENKKKMRETLGYSLDEFSLSENYLKPSANFAEELMHLIQTNLEPFETDHCFGKSPTRDTNPYFEDSGSCFSDTGTLTSDEKKSLKRVRQIKKTTSTSRQSLVSTSSSSTYKTSTTSSRSRSRSKEPPTIPTTNAKVVAKRRDTLQTSSRTVGEVILRKSRLKRRSNESIEKTNVRQFKEVVYLSPSRVSPKSSKVSTHINNESRGVKSFISLLNERISRFVASLFLGRSSNNKPLTTRIPIKKDSNLKKKLINEIRQKNKENEKIGIFSLIKSAFRFNDSPMPLKQSQLSPSLSHFKYRQPDLVHANYNEIFESMKEADEKNRRLTTKRFNLVVDKGETKPRATTTTSQQQQQQRNIKMFLVQVTVLVFFTFTNIYFVFDSFKKC